MHEAVGGFSEKASMAALSVPIDKLTLNSHVSEVRLSHLG
jgi:hypothetical protein